MIFVDCHPNSKSSFIGLASFVWKLQLEVKLSLDQVGCHLGLQSSQGT